MFLITKYGISAIQNILFCLQRPTHPNIDLKRQKVLKSPKNNHETIRNRPKFVYHKVPGYSIPPLTPDAVHKAYMPPPGSNEKQYDQRRRIAFDGSPETKSVGEPPQYPKR